MPGIRGFVSNLRAATSSPAAWWLARQSIIRHGAIQHVDELTEFTRMLRLRPPRAVLEIGTAQGGMFWLLCRISAEDATLVSLDLPPEDRHSGGRHIPVDLRSMSQPAQTVHVLQQDSHDVQTHARVSALIGERTLDLLFIDGDHTYDGVRQDFEMYCSLVRPGGLIAFHDIVNTPWPGCQVDRFWNEIVTNRSLRPRAIVGRVPSDFGGIGVVTAP